MPEQEKDPFDGWIVGSELSWSGCSRPEATTTEASKSLDARGNLDGRAVSATAVHSAAEQGGSRGSPK